MVSHPEHYHDVLQRIMKVELAGVLRYTHYAVMVRTDIITVSGVPCCCTWWL